MRLSHGWPAIWALVFAGLFSFTGACFGGDNARSDKSQNSANSAGERSTNSDRQNIASDKEDDAEHHAALGVSLGQTATGVSIVGVMPGSPAARVGLRVGDEIRYVGNQRVRTPAELIEEIGEHRPGSQIELSIRRNGERQTLTAQLASQQSIAAYHHRTNREMTGGNDQLQASRVREPRTYSYGPDSGQMTAQQLSQQVRALQMQVQQLHQTINGMRAQSGYSSYETQANGTEAGPEFGGGSDQGNRFPARRWNYLQRHGEANDDPALFQ